ncbi:hypothetical protein [Pseudoalteromonas byunsanensis]|uniref:Uncharacterized protein n=1 Tax=Pseudoalteromonas byunsanensis TaxID=327939 RepID=A0A1S1N779_9GAMM|nr:hypothetical protein [Pseudoalteromonas byunsanensis]OHU95220.1 hypothetical protein BIW53_10875 [Pseudoalteromonas byunsanensis]
MCGTRFLSGVKANVQAAKGFDDVVLYRKGRQAVYIKHVFMNKLPAKVKPDMSAQNIEFIKQLDTLNLRCYVLVHVKNKLPGEHDLAFFLDDYEAIQGVSKEVAMQRTMPLASATHLIDTILL